MALPSSFLPVFEMSAFEWGHKCPPEKSNFHSQLLKETVSCDAFLLDINRSREDQVIEGKQPGLNARIRGAGTLNSVKMSKGLQNKL